MSSHGVFIGSTEAERAHLQLQAGDTEAVVVSRVQELAQHPSSPGCLWWVAMAHALVGLVGQGEAASVLLVRGGIQGRFGVRGERQGALAVARTHGVRCQVPFVGWHSAGRATLLVYPGCWMGVEAGVGEGVGGEGEAGVGVCVEVGGGVGLVVGVGVWLGVALVVRAGAGLRLGVGV